MSISGISIYKSVILGGSCGTQNVSFSLNPTDLQVLNQRLRQFGFNESLSLDNLSAQGLSRAIFGNNDGVVMITRIAKNAEDSIFSIFGWDGDLASADITLKLPANASAEQIDRLREVLNALHLQCNLPVPPSPPPPPTPPTPPVITPPVQPPPVQPRDAGTQRPERDAEVEIEDNEPQLVAPGISLGNSNYDPDTGRMTININVRGQDVTADSDIEVVISSRAVRIIGSPEGEDGSVSLLLDTANADPGSSFNISVTIDENRLGSVRVQVPEESENQ
ncbi:hypothetical protein HZC35_03550 [Candidatus Saganbacteria bacterium]|nr:hypothetical protein [Candidatus Saganbacteria bacterium]